MTGLVQFSPEAWTSCRQEATLDFDRAAVTTVTQLGSYSATHQAVLSAEATSGGLGVDEALLVTVAGGIVLVPSAAPLRPFVPSIKHIHLVPLHDLGDARHRLALPIMVSVEERAPDDFVACLYEPDVYGYGSSIPESLEDLRQHLIDQYEYLASKDAEGVLGPVPQKQLAVLRGFLGEGQ